MQTKSQTRSPARSSFASATGGFVTTASRAPATAPSPRGQNAPGRR